MTVPRYDKGDRVRLSVAFTNLSGIPTNPTTITFKAKKPDNTVVSYTTPDAQIVNDGTGLYHVDLDVDQSGDWAIRWQGTGAIVAAEETWITVKASAF